MVKRAGFKIGIGRELYSAPFTFIPSSKLPTKQDEKNQNRWVLEDQFTKFAVSDIGYDSKRKINRLVIINQKTGEVLYSYGMNNTEKQSAPKQRNTAPKQDAPKQDAPKQEVQKQEVSKSAIESKVNAVVETSTRIPNENKPPHQKLFENFLDRHKIDQLKFVSLVNQARKDNKGVTNENLKTLPPDEWVKLLATMEALFEEGYFK